MHPRITTKRLAGVAFCLLVSAAPLYAQPSESLKKYVRIGTLQTRFTAYGSERAWNDIYYEGMIWPADYAYADNAVIERQWIACQDFTDAKGQSWPHYGVYFAQAYAGSSLFPVEHKQTSRFDLPTVYVDGSDINAPYREDIDEVDAGQIADRVVHNVVNTSMGVTMTRRILAFSQQYHDNYMIKEYTFKNTGFVDATSNRVLTAPIKGLRFGFGVRYSVSYEGALRIANGQNWGKHTWVTRRGEDYALHQNDILTESSPIPQWLRAGFSWAGQAAENSFDNVGGPYLTGNGRLCAPQFAGIVTLHVDKSAADKSDDPSQPVVLGWHAGDTYPNVGDMSIATAPMHTDLYTMLAGTPYQGRGHPTERMDEAYLASQSDAWKVHGDGGGTNLWMAFGPFDLNPGDSVVIVLAEGVDGLNRETCVKIGERWKKAHDNSADNGPFALPDGSTTTNEDVYKNAWVYTGKDSIMKTFSRAKRNFDLGYMIPQPPIPPPLFNVTSGGDRISLNWELSPSEGFPGFGGYKIYRAVGKTDTTFEEIASLPPGTKVFDDKSPVRGYAYYYYISAFTDGSDNASGGPNPTGPLLSSRFYTRTNQPASLKRPAGPPPRTVSDTVQVSAIQNDSNTVLFRLNSRYEGEAIGVTVTEFALTLVTTSGGQLTITPPEGMLPIQFGGPLDPSAAFTFTVDSATVANTAQMRYSVKMYDARSADMVEIRLNESWISLPSSIVSPFNKRMEAIRIVPNPFNVAALDLQYPSEPDKIMFLNVPGHCVIRIYTENGDLINTLYHEDGSGDQPWNSVTSSRQVVVSGVYIAHFTVTEDDIDERTGEVRYRKGETSYQKFVIIR